jgi:hypothetical protein
MSSFWRRRANLRIITRETQIVSSFQAVADDPLRGALKLCPGGHDEPTAVCGKRSLLTPKRHNC